MQSDSVNHHYSKRFAKPKFQPSSSSANLNDNEFPSLPSASNTEFGDQASKAPHCYASPLHNSYSDMLKGTDANQKHLYAPVVKSSETCGGNSHQISSGNIRRYGRKTLPIQERVNYNTSSSKDSGVFHKTQTHKDPKQKVDYSVQQGKSLNNAASKQKSFHENKSSESLTCAAKCQDVVLPHSSAIRNPWKTVGATSNVPVSEWHAFHSTVPSVQGLQKKEYGNSKSHAANNPHYVNKSTVLKNKKDSKLSILPGTIKTDNSHNEHNLKSCLEGRKKHSSIGKESSVATRSSNAISVSNITFSSTVEHNVKSDQIHHLAFSKFPEDSCCNLNNSACNVKGVDQKCINEQKPFNSQNHKSGFTGLNISEAASSRRKKQRPSKVKRQKAFQTGKLLILSTELHNRIADQLYATSESQSQKEPEPTFCDINDSSEYPELSSFSSNLKKGHSKPLHNSKQSFAGKLVSETVNINIDIIKKKERDAAKMETSVTEMNSNEGCKLLQVENDNFKVKPCPRLPVHIVDLINISKETPFQARKYECVSDVAQVQKGKVSQAKKGPNVLDSSAPVVKRGKERERPKNKKCTPLKKIILLERAQRKMNNEKKYECKALMCEEQNYKEYSDNFNANTLPFEDNIQNHENKGIDNSVSYSTAFPDVSDDKSSSLCGKVELYCVSDMDVHCFQTEKCGVNCDCMHENIKCNPSHEVHDVFCNFDAHDYSKKTFMASDDMKSDSGETHINLSAAGTPSNCLVEPDELCYIAEIVDEIVKHCLVEALEVVKCKLKEPNMADNVANGLSSDSTVNLTECFNCTDGKPNLSACEKNELTPSNLIINSCDTEIQTKDYSDANDLVRQDINPGHNYSNLFHENDKIIPETSLKFEMPESDDPLQHTQGSCYVENFSNCAISNGLVVRAEFPIHVNDRANSYVDNFNTGYEDHIHSSSPIHSLTDCVSLMEQVSSPTNEESHSHMQEREDGKNPIDSGFTTIDESLIEGKRMKAVEIILHTRSFREYCSHLLSKDLDECATSLISNLYRFQDRVHKKDPVKGYAKRRMLYGIKEVVKHLKLKKVKCVIIAPNLENIESKGGLNDTLRNLIKLSQEYHVPCVFASDRKKLGKINHKPVPVSCIGIFNYEGAEADFKKMLEICELSVKDYKAICKILKNSLKDENMINDLISVAENSPQRLLPMRVKAFQQAFKEACPDAVAGLSCSSYEDFSTKYSVGT